MDLGRAARHLARSPSCSSAFLPFAISHVAPRGVVSTGPMLLTILPFAVIPSAIGPLEPATP
eukprot:9726929-Karenia_brevis.AAC.1